MIDIVERLRAQYDAWNNPPSPELPDGADVALEAADEITRLRATLQNMEQHMEENITLTEAFRNEQEWVLRLSKALRGVLRVADRNTKEFNEARAALEGKQ